MKNRFNEIKRKLKTAEEMVCRTYMYACVSQIKTSAEKRCCHVEQRLTQSTACYNNPAVFSVSAPAAFVQYINVKINMRIVLLSVYRMDVNLVHIRSVDVIVHLFSLQMGQTNPTVRLYVVTVDGSSRTTEFRPPDSFEKRSDLI